jgi:hypothetical protein
VSSGDPAVVACKTRSPAPRCGGAGLMAMVMARGFRILVLSRKSFTGTGLRATGLPEPATERRTAAAVTDPSWQRHPGRQAHRGNQRPDRRDACHLGP